MTTKVKDTDARTEAKQPMDIEHLRSLVELMVVNDLSRIELREGDSHILLRRGQPVVAGAAAALVPQAVAQLAAPVAASVGDAAAAAAAEATSNEIIIRSPMVGTFYQSPDPESPPFLNVGTVVEPNTVVCLIEAMKVYNELKAEVSGRVAKILVKNAQAVEFDQPLFAIVPA
jgi:acetyl-CoA carboxylase biotin carboxyl carrier protein